jgi:hypothetical protein
MVSGQASDELVGCESQGKLNAHSRCEFILWGLLSSGRTIDYYAKGVPSGVPCHSKWGPPVVKLPVGE